MGLELVEITNEALRTGIRACGPGRPFKGIGEAIHSLTRHSNFSVSSQFTGHGIGTRFHRPPWILHHRTLPCPLSQLSYLKFTRTLMSVNEEPGIMKPGDCFTIEVGWNTALFYLIG